MFSANSFFSRVLARGNIPIQNLVRVTTTNDGAIATTPSKREVPLIYEEESFAIKASSEFKSIGNPKSNTLLSMLSNETGGAIPSGQFALQSVQTWDTTQPLEFSVEVNLYMLDNGYDDVVYPTQQLMKLCLPTIQTSGAGKKLGLLIPPGPSFTEILEMSFSEASAGSVDDVVNIKGSLVNVTIGKFKFTNCIVTEVSPTFSSTVDEKGYPISASVSIEFRTCMVATRDMIDSMTSKGGV